jgi:hypothetical protein
MSLSKSKCNNIWSISMYKLAFENLVFKDMNFFFGNYESTVEEFDSKIYDEIHFRSNFTLSLRTSGKMV